MSAFPAGLLKIKIIEPQRCVLAGVPFDRKAVSNLGSICECVLRTRRGPISAGKKSAVVAVSDAFLWESFSKQRRAFNYGIFFLRPLIPLMALLGSNQEAFMNESWVFGKQTRRLNIDQASDKFKLCLHILLNPVIQQLLEAGRKWWQRLCAHL